MVIKVSDKIKRKFPELVVGFLEGPVTNGVNNRELWQLVGERTMEIVKTMDAEKIRQVPGIQAGKSAYRHLGKDPNRYRLSAEALMRRIVKGQGLHPINTCVDVLNLVSLRTGITIGGFDRNCIIGEVELAIGKSGEEFDAIGRGLLNVFNLPVYRDREGAIGNPTSDCTRTQINETSASVLMLITGFYGSAGIPEALGMLNELLGRFCSGYDFKTGIISG